MGMDEPHMIYTREIHLTAVPKWETEHTPSLLSENGMASKQLEGKTAAAG